ncbi:hypothetical protein [Kribbella catacumbae]|uniref:hypothetical protein n=1 Tax=Kribbella catacumbae TaxID=460086 RepID=UPI0012F9B8BF|nr:hypothetical protein [Kribbella catacumbae]
MPSRQLPPGHGRLLRDALRNRVTVLQDLSEQRTSQAGVTLRIGLAMGQPAKDAAAGEGERLHRGTAPEQSDVPAFRHHPQRWSRADAGHRQHRGTDAVFVEEHR